MKPSMRKRAKVLFIGYIVCVLVTVGLLLEILVRVGSDTPLVSLALGSLVPHLGPIALLLVGMTPPTFSFWFWWAVLVGTNIAFISAYLVRPNIVTAIISFLGIAIWFFFGLFVITTAG